MDSLRLVDSFIIFQSEEKQMIGMLPNGHRIKQSWNNRNDGGLDKMELTRKYFEVLDDEDIEKLYFIYETDFQMFGYSFELRGKQYN